VRYNLIQVLCTVDCRLQVFLYFLIAKWAMGNEYDALKMIYSTCKIDVQYCVDTGYRYTV
jgi:hypothetical protein